MKGQSSRLVAGSIWSFPQDSWTQISKSKSNTILLYQILYTIYIVYILSIYILYFSIYIYITIDSIYFKIKIKTILYILYYTYTILYYKSVTPGKAMHERLLNFTGNLLFCSSTYSQTVNGRVILFIYIYSKMKNR